MFTSLFVALERGSKSSVSFGTLKKSFFCGDGKFIFDVSHAVIDNRNVSSRDWIKTRLIVFKNWTAFSSEHVLIAVCVGSIIQFGFNNDKNSRNSRDLNMVTKNPFELNKNITCAETCRNMNEIRRNWFILVFHMHQSLLNCLSFTLHDFIINGFVFVHQFTINLLK